MPITPDQVRSQLAEAGLVAAATTGEWQELCARAAGDYHATDSAFLGMAVLDEVYGTESDDPDAGRRRVMDRVFVFNEFHETPRDAFFGAIEPMCVALGIENVAGDDDDDDDLPFETITDLADALNEALTGGAHAYVYGYDTWDMILIREAPPRGALWDELTG